MSINLDQLCQIVAGEALNPLPAKTITGCAIDSRQIKQGFVFIALKGERVDGHQFLAPATEKGAVAALVEYLPNTVPQGLACIKVADARRALGQLAAFWRQQHSLPLIAVTGSNGKTTLKEMLRAIFSQKYTVLATQGNLNNDLGVPLTLCQLNDTHEMALIEMGANHLGEIAYLSQMAQPTVAAITLCAPAHLQGFGNIDSVAQAKGEIFTALATHGTAVINADDTYAAYWQNLLHKQTVIRFACQQPAEIFARNTQMFFDKNQWVQRFILYTPQGEIDLVLPLLGQHNVMNALAACACALACGLDLASIQAGLQAMQAVNGRLRQRTGKNHSLLLDDCYNANPSSLAAGLAVLARLPAPRYLVLGDMGELGEASASAHQQVATLARQAGVDYLFAVGSFSALTVAQWANHGKHFSDKDALATALLAHLRPHSSVLVKGSRSQGLETVVAALLE